MRCADLLRLLSAAPGLAARPLVALLGLVRYAMLCALVLAGLLALRLAVRRARRATAGVA